MSQIIVRNRNGKPISIEATCPEDLSDETRVLWKEAKSDIGFILKFKCQGRWYFQGMHWSCRGGKQHYYKAMVALYRALRKRDLVPKNSLRKLAVGASVLELRLNGIVLKRGHDTEIEQLYAHISKAGYSKDDQQFNERRKALREELNVPIWEGKLELFRLRSPYSDTPAANAWQSTSIEDDSVDVMDTEAIRRVEHEKKYGRSTWTTTAAALLQRRFGSSDTLLLKQLLTTASHQPPGTRSAWINTQVAQASV